MVSALHGRGTGDLLDEIVRRLPPPAGEETEPTVDSEDSASRFGGAHGEPEEPATRVAIVGRPNVGKSTLFNKMLGEERSVVHDLPGTTRDAIDTQIDTDVGPVRFIDTAGMRRRSRTEEGTEYYAMVRALQALDHADVVLLVIDATEGVTHQDQRLAERIGASGSPVVVVLNKWELLGAEDRRDVVDAVEDRLAFLGESPVVKVSARSGMGVHKILPALGRAVEAYHHRIPTGELNRAIRSIQSAHAAPGSRIRYAVQGAIDPPTFTLFATRRLPAPYLRYVERKLREQFGIGPTPVKFRVRIGS
jgi:GTP-binding protein